MQFYFKFYLQALRERKAQRAEEERKTKLAKQQLAARSAALRQREAVAQNQRASKAVADLQNAPPREEQRPPSTSRKSLGSVAGRLAALMLKSTGLGLRHAFNRLASLSGRSTRDVNVSSMQISPVAQPAGEEAQAAAIVVLAPAPEPTPAAIAATQYQGGPPPVLSPNSLPPFQRQQQSPLKLVILESPGADSPRIQAAGDAPAVTRAASRRAAVEALVEKKEIFARVSKPLGSPAINTEIAAGVVEAQPDPGSAVPDLNLPSPQKTDLETLLAPGARQEDAESFQMVDSVLPLSPVSPRDLKQVFGNGY